MGSIFAGVSFVCWGFVVVVVVAAVAVLAAPVQQQTRCGGSCNSQSATWSGEPTEERAKSKQDPFTTREPTKTA